MTSCEPTERNFLNLNRRLFSRLQVEHNTPRLLCIIGGGGRGHTCGFPYLVSWVLLALCGWLLVESEELDSE